MAFLVLLSILTLPCFLICLGSGTLILDLLTIILLLLAVPGALIVTTWLQSKLGDRRGIAVVLAICIAFIGFGMIGTSSDTAAPEAKAPDAEEQAIIDVSGIGNASNSAKQDLDEEPAKDENPDPSHSSGGGPIRVPQHKDERWPTTSPTLIAIPEYQRWYNARQHMGSCCTIVGPVISVFQATDEPGAPVFVDIGEAYPSNGNVTLLIWAQDIAPFLDMLNDVDDGGAWISVTGYLNNYEGMPQFNSAMSAIECTWWTNVK